MSFILEYALRIAIVMLACTPIPNSEALNVIPVSASCTIIFDGDYQNVGKDDEDATIAKNRGILRLFNIDDDFPDGAIHENYLGFVYRLEENLGIDGIGNAKALSLFRRVKKEITSLEKVPCWVVEVITAIRKLPAEATSVLAE